MAGGTGVSLLATCALGLEEFLERELVELGALKTQRERGAVSFEGSWIDCWRANYWLRTANRVLIRLGSWPAEDGDALARGAERLVVEGFAPIDGVPCDTLFHPGRSLAVRATSAASKVRDTRWVALRVKDGLVDGQRRRFGRRSSIDRRSPDLALRLWLHRDRATLLLDTSREPLDHRGYRVESASAPLRENLAAACVAASGWDGRGPVVDPMCGSGTLLIEAGMLAQGLAPGCLRSQWAFERFPGFDRAAFEAIRGETRRRGSGSPVLVGIDRASDAVRAAKANLRKIALDATVTRGDGFDFEAPQGPGLLLVNPAYGVRLEEEADQWRRLGDLLKQRYRGWRAVVIAGGETRGKPIGLRPKRRWPVRNGPLDARILVFDLY